MYKITITELFNPTEVHLDKSPVQIVRYEQTVDTLDIYAVINAVNSAMPAGNRKQRSDAGKPRKNVPMLTPDPYA